MATEDMEFDAEELFCNACQHEMPSHSARVIHYKTDWHRYNVKRHCAGLSSLTERIFLQKVSEIKAQAKNSSAVECTLCNTQFKNENAFVAHRKTKKHLRNYQKYQKSQAKAAAAQAAQEKKEATQKAAADLVSNSDEKSMPMDTTEQSDFDPPIPLNSCLFCMRSFDTFRGSIEHMETQHSFFIPFPTMMADLPGCMEYLGAKVGMGHACLFCPVTKASTEAIRSHMISKGHCMFEPNKDPEILEFYTVLDDDEDDATDTPMEVTEASEKEDGPEVESKSASKPSGRKPHAFNEFGELVMSDGSIIGHRQYARIYRQRVRPQDTRESTVAVEEHARTHGNRYVMAPDSRGHRSIIRVGGAGQASQVSRYQRGPNAIMRKGYSEKALKVQRRMDKLRLRVGIQTNAQKFFFDYHTQLM